TTDETEWKQAQLRSRTYEQHNMLLKAFSPEQTERFEVYRRSALSKPNIKKLVSSIFGYSCSNNISIVVAGFSKIFIGEIIEKALDIKNEWGSEGPLSPDHIREAFRRYKKENKFTLHNCQRRLLRH
ncbi:5417_t:CDS:2, partial [Acaulospora morrowiae]